MDREKLIDSGIDYDDGVHRFAGKPLIYEKYLCKFFLKNDLPTLRRAIESEDYDTAFRTAHNIKGGAGNLSITKFYDKICEIVEILRAGKQDETLLLMCSDAEKLYETAYNAVKENIYGPTN